MQFVVSQVKKGDRIKLTRDPNGVEVKGTIIAIVNRGTWATDPIKYKVKYDGEFIPQEDWYEEYQIMLINDYAALYTPIKKCECGKDSVKDGGRHSNWCPKLNF